MSQDLQVVSDEVDIMRRISAKNHPTCIHLHDFVDTKVELCFFGVIRDKGL